MFLGSEVKIETVRYQTGDVRYSVIEYLHWSRMGTMKKPLFSSDDENKAKEFARNYDPYTGRVLPGSPEE